MRLRFARLLLVPVDLVVGFVILLDELGRPLYRPLIAWLASLRLVLRIEAWIAGLPPYGVLLMLALPFAIAEPLKLVALVMLARGAWLSGIVTMALAYLGSFVLVERVYQAGRAKLLTIGWFARCMAWLENLRRTVIERVKATALWRRAVAAASAVKQRLRGWVARWRWLRRSRGA